MPVRMLVTRRGTPDGFRLLRYEAGHAYRLPRALAQRFLRCGHAIIITFEG